MDQLLRKKKAQSPPPEPLDYKSGENPKKIIAPGSPQIHYHTSESRPLVAGDQSQCTAANVEGGWAVGSVI